MKRMNPFLPVVQKTMAGKYIASVLILLLTFSLLVPPQYGLPPVIARSTGDFFLSEVFARLTQGLIRPGLPQRTYQEWALKGMMTDAEFNAMRQMAMSRPPGSPPIVLTGSVSETPVGMLNRMDASRQALLPPWRAAKPQSSLNNNATISDIDVWQGSNLSADEMTNLRTIFGAPDAEIDANGYSLKKYADTSNFGQAYDPATGGNDGGALIFNPDGSVERVQSSWQDPADCPSLLSAMEASHGKVYADTFVSQVSKTFSSASQNALTSLKDSFSVKSLLITTGVAVGTNVIGQLLSDGKVDVDETVKAVVSAEFAGNVIGSALGAAGGQFAATIVRAAVPGVAGCVLSAFIPVLTASLGGQMGSSLGGDLKEGRFDVKAAWDKIDKWDLVGSSIGSTIGMLLGSAIAPPIGSIVGGIVGGLIGSKIAAWAKGLFQNDKNAIPEETAAIVIDYDENNRRADEMLDASVISPENSPFPSANNENSAANPVVLAPSDDLDKSYDECVILLKRYEEAVNKKYPDEAVRDAYEKYNTALESYMSMREAAGLR